DEPGEGLPAAVRELGLGRRRPRGAPGAGARARVPPAARARRGAGGRPRHPLLRVRAGARRAARAPAAHGPRLAQHHAGRVVLGPRRGDRRQLRGRALGAAAVRAGGRRGGGRLGVQRPRARGGGGAGDGGHPDPRGPGGARGAGVAAAGGRAAGDPLRRAPDAAQAARPRPARAFALPGAARAGRAADLRRLAAVGDLPRPPRRARGPARAGRGALRVRAERGGAGGPVARRPRLPLPVGARGVLHPAPRGVPLRRAGDRATGGGRPGGRGRRGAARGGRGPGGRRRAAAPRRLGHRAGGRVARARPRAARGLRPRPGRRRAAGAARARRRV
ncbi:MAG: Glycosyltransferase, partial [uncultured Gemmatimonadaceae bacterium]